MSKDQRLGILFAIIGSMLWGTSGSVAQFVFTNKSISPLWLVGIRMFFAGSLLLIWYGISDGKKVFSIWKNRSSAITLLFFAFLGMLPSQLAYFMAIKYGNAPTATVLQFLGPLFIIIYLAIANWKMPRRIDLISIALALFGTFLLVTQGHFNKLALAPLALIWGLLAGLSQASYTLIPRKLLHELDARLVVGWAMLLGSIPFLPVVVTTKVSHITLSEILSVIFIVIFGTMFAYLLYLKSVQHIEPSTTGMLSAFEPLTATILSVTLLSTPISTPEIIGGIFILATAFLQSIGSKS
ncbi:DMT family transporter [Companilactobacillus zhongbaensis]|uniref:DMT family transporter n=1 Tax=Companilactobacillus zhongbaensis TaxID=2486009 RepID=UPI000F7795A0|nr:DMT family transporter [Companilactobacillus zhongbaensis]